MTQLASATFLADAVLFVRDRLLVGITDPLAGVPRPTGEKFIMTEFPRRSVTHPFMIVRDSGMSDIQRSGMRSEGIYTRINIEIHIHAKNVVQRDELAQQVYAYMRTNQFGVPADSDNNSAQFGLHDIRLVNMINIPNVNGDGGIRKKVLEYSFAMMLI